MCHVILCAFKYNVFVILNNLEDIFSLIWKITTNIKYKTILKMLGCIQGFGRAECHCLGYSYCGHTMGFDEQNFIFIIMP